MDRNWSAIWIPDVELAEQHRATANDLDLFGQASLFQLISNAFTPMGINTLRDWLLEPPASESIKQRQDAIKRLIQKVEWREELCLQGRILSSSPSGPQRFVEWSEGHCWLLLRPALKWTVNVLTFVVPLTIVLTLVRGIPIEIGLIACGVGILVNVFISVFLSGRVHDIFDTVSSRSNDIQQYQRIFGLFEELTNDSPLLAELKSKLRTNPPAEVLLGKLARIIGFANLRRSATTAIVYVIVQMVFLQDFHILAWLERWQRAHGKKVRGWFEATGQLEALSSLATLAYDNPHWCWPEATDDLSAPLAAASIGHPLLKDDVAVRNDVQVGPGGRFLLVTGSNMSGKSTMLRSIGLNAILAQTGAPACATSLSLPPVEVSTSMRVQDSLDDGVSFFMAELQRLKEIVDHSGDLAKSSNRRLLFLLDEILQGTNSVERHIAVSRVIERLVANGSLGAVSTHDLELARSPELVPNCQIVHFREQIEGDGADEKMTFDYKMRSGVAPTTNALKLLKLVGLDEPETGS